MRTITTPTAAAAAMKQDSQTTYDVVLPRDVEAKFPDRCIGCGADSPTAKIKGFARTGGAFNLLTTLFSRKVVAFAPACTSCRKAHRWSTELLEAALLVAMVGVMGLLHYLIQSINALQPIVDDVPKFIGKRLSIIVAFLLVGPFWFILHKRIKPPLFEMDIAPGAVEYNFRDAEYANDFEELNQTDGVSREPDNEPIGKQNSPER